MQIIITTKNVDWLSFIGRKNFPLTLHGCFLITKRGKLFRKEKKKGNFKAVMIPSKEKWDGWRKFEARLWRKILKFFPLSCDPLSTSLSLYICLCAFLYVYKESKVYVDVQTIILN